jgi:hypothetical protein
MDLQDEAAAATRARADEPGVELVPFLVADGVVLRVAPIRREPAAAVLRQAAQGAGFDGVDVLRGAGHARGDDDPAPRLGDG